MMMMKVPHTIPWNAFQAYRCSPETRNLPLERSRTLRAEDEHWDDSIVPDLRILALGAIAANWHRVPIFDTLPTCMDRAILLEILPVNSLPLEITVPRIGSEFFWKRCATARWEYNDPAGEHGGSWRRLYCERHFAEYLEGLEATYFREQRESCEKLITLLRDRIYTLRIRFLVPTKRPSIWTRDDNKGDNDIEVEEEDECPPEDHSVDHIPFDEILVKLPRLTAFYLNFGMIYMNDGFEWRDFEFSVEDCVKLGKGLKDCSSLEKFALTRSNLDQPRAAAILQGLAVNNNITELDFSHCKLADTGAHAVGEFLSMHRGLRALSLSNNGIGPSGLSGLVHGLLRDCSAPLKILNLRLNPLGDEGAESLVSLLLRHRRLEDLNISGCEIKTEGGIELSEVIASGSMPMGTLKLDVSNNDFGIIAGEAFEVSLRSCSTIVSFDCRMCNFSKESEYAIGTVISRNKIDHKKGKKMPMPRLSSLNVPKRAKSLLPPPEYLHFQKPHG